MKRYETIKAIMNEIQSNMNPGKTPLDYYTSKDTIKIHSDASVAFVIINSSGVITNIDLCYNNCLFKKYMSSDKLLDLNDKLKVYIGLEA